MAVAVSAELVLAIRALRLRGEPSIGPGLRGLFGAAAERLDPDLADRPLSGDLEAARLLLFDDALWMKAELATDA
jgi:histidine ammonia-lyase